MKILLSLLFILMTTFNYAQIISQFDFDSNPVTVATVGPNATSISASATSSPGGTGGTNGLNAGLPKADLDMVIPGSSTFDVGGIDVSFDYRREENSGNFFERGESLKIIGFSQLRVTYITDNDTINSGNVYSIPNDDTYRRYRFVYTPCDGIGMLMVDNSIVWSNDGPDNVGLFWNTGDDVVVGDGMDGTGNDETFFDNLVIGEVTCSPLPIELISFDGYADGEVNVLNWSTASERNNDYFTIERSEFGMKWQEIGKIDGAGNSSVEIKYEFIDQEPLVSTSYYRLKQTDYDGKYEYFDIISIENESQIFYVYTKEGDNDHFYFSDKQYFELYNMMGQKVDRGESNQIDVSGLNPGIYLLKIHGYTQKLFLR